MANNKSAKKRAAKSAAQREKNRASRSMVRTAIKKVRQAATASDAQGTEGLLKEAISLVDRTARKGLIHPNAAARTKSRLSAAVAKASK
jgi:small subunit ribosomal protein S20